MDISEDEIWDTITASAKGKIDYAGFAALFPFNPDNFLSSIVYGFAIDRSTEVIAGKISAQVFMTGNTVDENALSHFIEGSHSKLKKEVTLTKMALQMLNDGDEPLEVYQFVLNSLNTDKSP
jgi:hypothetical protein